MFIKKLKVCCEQVKVVLDRAEYPENLPQTEHICHFLQVIIFFI